MKNTAEVNKELLDAVKQAVNLNSNECECDLDVVACAGDGIHESANTARIIEQHVVLVKKGTHAKRVNDANITKYLAVREVKFTAGKNWQRGGVVKSVSKSAEDVIKQALKTLKKI